MADPLDSQQNWGGDPVPSSSFSHYRDPRPAADARSDTSEGPGSETRAPTSAQPHMNIRAQTTVPAAPHPPWLFPPRGATAIPVRTNPIPPYPAPYQAPQYAVPSTHAPSSKSYVAKPVEYDGTTDFDSFLRSVQLYIYANPRQIVQDADKILLTLSYMKHGLAGTWAQNEYQSALFDDFGTPRLSPNFGDWESFLERLRASFDDPHKHRRAKEDLDKLRQGHDTAEAFFQKYETLRRHAQYLGSDFDDDNIRRCEKALGGELVKILIANSPPPPVSPSLRSERGQSWSTHVSAVVPTSTRCARLRQHLRGQHGVQPSRAPQCR